VISQMHRLSWNGILDQIFDSIWQELPPISLVSNLTKLHLPGSCRSHPTAGGRWQTLGFVNRCLSRRFDRKRSGRPSAKSFRHLRLTSPENQGLIARGCLSNVVLWQPTFGKGSNGGIFRRCETEFK
jgi:hypothetical protein